MSLNFQDFKAFEDEVQTIHLWAIVLAGLLAILGRVTYLTYLISGLLI